MSRVAVELAEQLKGAIRAHDWLQAVVQEIEKAQYVVFHDSPKANWDNAGRSAEQILIAEIITRYGADIEGVRAALRKLEQNGLAWSDAVRDLAARVQSYYSTPLGIVMRRNLFGVDAVFLSPEALEWVAGDKHT